MFDWKPKDLGVLKQLLIQKIIFLSFTGFYVLSAGGIYALVAKGVIVSTYAIPYFGYFLIFWGMSKLPPIRRFLDVRLPQLLKVK